ncbi:D-hexose-6-phosphate mutarotase [Limnohabitans sp.]|jgi:glucose-6-phosphate 1-epimerase|uniref:D-hexose-6-phosphate mutarotase n=1 Tax=Limnohabitans sp. TaxID=1907725 RepID=UPI0037C11E0D
MSTGATSRELDFAGLPATELLLPCGDRVVVAHHGAHVLSWLAGGRERLYLSPQSVMDGHAAIRGGIPVCFPQFNQRGDLPKHGFARHLCWTTQPVRLAADQAHLALRLSDSVSTRQWWGQAFEALLLIDLTPGDLQVQLVVRNTDSKPLCFTGALHTYFSVSDLAQTRLLGLGGHAEWDAVTDRHASGAPELRFVGEFDRVYAASDAGYVLHDGPHRLSIQQDQAWAQTVVWNPGAAKCSTLVDMPAEAWQHMLCVEAAQVFEPVRLQAGDFWQGGQRLSVV